MVPISSVWISRVPTYSGLRLLSQGFVYGRFTLFAATFQLLQLPIQILLCGPYPVGITTHGLGWSDFARHYSRNHCCFLFLRVLRCFSSPGSPRIPMDSVYDNTILLVLSSLIRISTDQRIFAPNRSFSQLVTSFFGAMYQGILRKPFVAWSSLFIYSSLHKNSISFNSANRYLQLKGLSKSSFRLCLLTISFNISNMKFCLCTRLFLLKKKHLI